MTFWIVYPLGLALWEKDKLSRFIPLETPLESGELSEEVLSHLKGGPKRAGVFLADPYIGSLIGVEYKSTPPEILKEAARMSLPQAVGDALLEILHLPSRDGVFLAALKEETLQVFKKLRVDFVAPLGLALAWALQKAEEGNALLVHYSEEGDFFLLAEKEAGEIRELYYYVHQGGALYGLGASIERELFRYREALASGTPLFFAYSPPLDLPFLENARIHELTFPDQPDEALLFYPKRVARSPLLEKAPKLLLTALTSGVLAFLGGKVLESALLSPIEREIASLQAEAEGLSARAKGLQALRARKAALEETLKRLEEERGGVEEALFQLAQIPDGVGVTATRLSTAPEGFQIKVQAKTLPLLEEYVRTLRKAYKVEYQEIKVGGGLIKASLKVFKGGED